MDPRLRSILLQLLQLAVEQETAAFQPSQDPMRQPPPEREGPYAPGSLGYDLEQLEAPRHHYAWPFSPQVTDFGPA